jgi:hypothetical protein
MPACRSGEVRSPSHLGSFGDGPGRLGKRASYNGSVESAFDLTQATIVAYYIAKPAPLLDFVVRVQEGIERALGNAFRAYDPRQVHATIVGLESTSREGEAVDLDCILERLRQTDLLPMEIQIGGFKTGTDYGFTSRGLSPSARSFTLRDGVALGIGWPVSGGRYPDSLDRLRRTFQDMHVQHKYHRAAGDVDNDLYFVLGHCSPDLSAAAGNAVEREIGSYFASKRCLVPLRQEDLSIAWYTDEALPLASTLALPVAGETGESVRALIHAGGQVQL